MPGQLPSTGRTSEGYGAIGQAFGGGMSDFVKKAYVDPQAEIMKNKMMMNQDPNTLYKDMINMYTVFKDMPQYLQDQVSAQPGFQAKLQKIEQLFPGYIIPGEKGGKTFAIPVLKAEEAKARRVEELRREGKGDLADSLVFATERKEAATGKYYEAEEQKTREHEMPKLGAERKLFDVKAELYPAESAADIQYKKLMGEAAERESERKATLDPAQAAADRQEARFAAQTERDEAKQTADEAKANRAAQAKELLTALSTYSTNVRQRQSALATGKTANRYAIVLDDASDLITFLDSTAHLPQAGSQQMNLSIGTLESLAHTYERALKEKKDPKILNSLRQRAYDIYDRFLYRTEDGKIVNALDSKQTKKIMSIFEKQRTTKSAWGETEYTIPSNMGLINTLSTKLLGGTSSSLWD